MSHFPSWPTFLLVRQGSLHLFCSREPKSPISSALIIVNAELIIVPLNITSMGFNISFLLIHECFQELWAQNWSLGNTTRKPLRLFGSCQVGSCFRDVLMLFLASLRFFNGSRLWCWLKCCTAKYTQGIHTIKHHYSLTEWTTYFLKEWRMPYAS